MTTPLPARRPGRPDLLTHVAGDLGDCQIRRRADGGANVTSPDGTTFDLDVRVERRRLMTLEETCAVVTGPVVVGDGRGRIVLHHTGQIRRRGLAAKLRGECDDEVAALRDRLVADGELEAASLPLDVTRFQIVASGGRWRAELLLMGGSHVRTRLPPGGSYVRLAADQVSSLLATVRVLHDRLPAEPRLPDALAAEPPASDDLATGAVVTGGPAASPARAGVVAGGRAAHLPSRRR